MAIKQTNANRDFNTWEYVIDSSEDVNGLPTNIGWGSTAICIENGAVYILDSSQTWVVLGGNMLESSDG